MSGHTTVSIANKIIDKIDEYIDREDTNTYSTRSDFIKDALRKRLRELGVIK
jgi:metal-responsive CopG/Arc/MetJ family transcriptional regulator